jgi:hypothetical protein
MQCSGKAETEDEQVRHKVEGISRKTARQRFSNRKKAEGMQVSDQGEHQ